MPAIKLSNVSGRGAIESGRILRTIAPEVNGKPTLPADGSLINPAIHPELAAILESSYTPLSAIELPGTGRFPSVSGDGVRVLRGSILSSDFRLEYLVNDVLIDSGIISNTIGNSFSCLSRDGLKGFGVVFEVASDDIEMYFINSGGTGLSPRTLNAAYTGSSSYIGGCISADGTKSYIMYRTSGASTYTLLTSSDGFQTAGFTTVSGITIPGASYSNVYSMTTSYDGQYIYVLTDSSQILVSTDYGITFSRIVIPATVNSDTFSTCSDDGSLVIFASASAVYRTLISSDYGVTFYPLNLGGYMDTLSINVTLSVGIIPGTNNILGIFAGSEPNVDAPVRALGYSEDQGQSWVIGRHYYAQEVNYSMLGTLFQSKPLAITSDGLEIITYNDGTNLKVTLEYDKFLPLVRGYKVVGG